jgi:hypothetical protein
MGGEQVMNRVSYVLAPFISYCHPQGLRECHLPMEDAVTQFRRRPPRRGMPVIHLDGIIMDRKTN